MRDHVNDFISACRTQFDVKSIYLEMNGFDISCDRWYFDSFGYSVYFADPDDLEWLCDWRSPDRTQFTLTGLERTQDDFRWYMEHKMWQDKSYERVKEIAVLLVMVRFVQLIRSALAAGQLVADAAVLATAHDFDMIGRFEPE